MKLQGFAGIDTSGNRSYLPIFACCAYSKTKEDFNKFYKEIFDSVIKQKPVLGYRKEIKSTDIKSESLMEKILKNISLEHKTVVVDGKLFDLLKKKFVRYPQWNLRLETCIWFASLKALDKLPSTVYLDYIAYEHTKVKFVEYLLTVLSKKVFGNSPYFQTTPSHEEVTVKLADIIADILRRNPKLRESYKKDVIYLSFEECADLMNKIRFERL